MKPEIVIKDFGNEYVIYRDGIELHTAYSPEDAECVASLLFQLEYAKQTLLLIRFNKPQDYCTDAFAPDERYTDIREVAGHAYAMVLDYDGGMYMWDLPCPECNGNGCEHCNHEGSFKSMFHPSTQKPIEEQS